MNKVKLTQTHPGSWAHITILVDGVVRFEAAKYGTDFWIIIVAGDKYTRIGSGDGKSGVKKTVQAFLKKNPLFLTSNYESEFRGDYYFRDWVSDTVKENRNK